MTKEKEKEKEKIIYTSKVILHRKSKHKHINKMDLVNENENDNESIYSEYASDINSDSDSSVEEVSLKPLRKAMKLIRQELDSTILTMVSVKESLEKESKESVKDILNKSLLLKTIDSGVKGVDVYDFIKNNI
jgi:hypothetical protein